VKGRWAILIPGAAVFAGFAAIDTPQNAIAQCWKEVNQGPCCDEGSYPVECGTGSCVIFEATCGDDFITNYPAPSGSWNNSDGECLIVYIVRECQGGTCVQVNSYGGTEPTSRQSGPVCSGGA
jgi:hypothetical protein